MSLSTVYSGQAASTAHTFSNGLVQELVPKYTLSEEGMSARAARQVVFDECLLDGQPAQNLASFVTTHMEQEAQDILLAGATKNLADQEEYPASHEIQERCVNILANLFHGSGLGALPPTDENAVAAMNPDGELSSSVTTGSIGTSTVGSSEAIMLGALAMKWRWRQWRARRADELQKSKGQSKGESGAPEGSGKTMLKAEGWATSSLMHGRAYGPGSGEPPCNMIVSAASHVCIFKACKYLDIQPRCIPLAAARRTLDPDLVAAALDENTIGVFAILGTTLTGEFDPIETIHAKLEQFNAKHQTEITLHVDGASGGFTVPFTHPNLKWDFRLPLVKSINTSGHKFGLVAPGVGWIIFRERTDLPADLVFRQHGSWHSTIARQARKSGVSHLHCIVCCSDVNYLGADEATFSLNFSRPASNILMQYYSFLRLGHSGYKRIIQTCLKNARHLAKSLIAMGVFDLLSANLEEGERTLPLVVCRFKPDKTIRRLLGFDERALVHELRTRGWIIPAYTLPKDCENIQVMRILVRDSITLEMIDHIVDDIQHKLVELMHRHVSQVRELRAELRGEQSNVSSSAGGDGSLFLPSGGSSPSPSPSPSPDPIADPDADARHALVRLILGVATDSKPHRRKFGEEQRRGARDSNKLNAIADASQANGHAHAYMWREQGAGQKKGKSISRESANQNQKDNQQMTAVVC